MHRTEPHRQPPLDHDADRSALLRLWVDQATDALVAARAGDLHPAAAGWHAWYTLGWVVQLLLSGPVDGWPCDDSGDPHEDAA